MRPPAAGTVYARGKKLWMGFVDPSGKQVYRRTGLRVGQEAEARRLLAAQPKGRSARHESRVYLVQPIPDVAPTRLKVGCSTSLTSRLRTYRVLCPGARVLAVVPGGRIAEQRLLRAFIGAPGVGRIGLEVFDVPDLEQALSLFRSATTEASRG